jgi:hypothetical protein
VQILFSNNQVVEVQQILGGLIHGLVGRSITHRRGTENRFTEVRARSLFCGKERSM